MIKSMTGFGRGQASSGGVAVTTEARSVNHRFLEIIVRLPRVYLELEERLKKLVRQETSRGRWELTVAIETMGAKQVNIDKNLAIAYHSAMKQIAELLDIPCETSPNHLLSLPEVVVVSEQVDIDAVWGNCELAARQALNEVRAMRVQEGEILCRDIAGQARDLRLLVQSMEALVPQLVAEHVEKLKIKIRDLCGDSVQLDRDRLLTEVALLAERSDINEELVRLSSHLQQVETALAAPGPIGRRLDFLAQEIAREINTIGAKSGSVQISTQVVEAKTLLEKFREQVQNVE